MGIGRASRRGWMVRLRRQCAVGVSLMMLVAAMGEAPARAAGWKPPAPLQVAGVPVNAATPVQPAALGRPRVARQRSVVWPAAGQAAVQLREAVSASPGAQDASGSGPVRAGNLPVHVGQSFDDDALSSSRQATMVERASVTVHDRASTARAGVDGLLLAVARADGKPHVGGVIVRVDYDQFADAYGGDWASRLRLVQLPACALSTPDAAGCTTATPLASRNDVTTRSVSAQVPVSGGEATVLAVQAGPTGDNGSYAATSLSQAGTWNVGLQTGDFNWSYPLQVPPSFGGPVPALGLAYSSGRIDGRTSATNNQAGWLGDGWDMWPGFIERRYASCADDNPSHRTGDMCWKTSNATLSLNGHASELIETGTPNVWRLRRDDGTRVERLTDAARDNGDDGDDGDDNEYWKVTTTNGTQYFFGYHKLPNWASGKPVTDSVWTVPVFGNNSGEPCHNSTFGNAWCDQAWRWNLDYVIDAHDNTMAYFYGKEWGGYGRNNTATLRTAYVRGGWLSRIEYGTRKNSEYAAAAPMRIMFDAVERCLESCWTGAAWTSAPNESAWPDTPNDQDCAAAPCTGKLSPTFWSQRRLSKVTTQVRSGATTYRDVDSWTMRHEFLDAGDNEGKPLWLWGITRTGHVTAAGGAVASVPEIVFSPGSDPLPNRVDGPADGRTSLTRFRIKNITTEAGGRINITYSGQDCTKADLPAPESNTRRCMPAFYAPVGTPTLDWFHKYVVTSVAQQDVQYTAGDGTVVANNPVQYTFYDHPDPPAWHYTDDEITPDKWKTWADWRGYARVQVRTGAVSGQQTAVEHRFLRGMDGDKQPVGQRDVWLPDSWGGSIEDHEALNGFTLQTITFNGPGGAEVGSTLQSPWRVGPTATRSSDGVTVNAWMINTASSRSRVAVAGGFRTAKTATTFDSEGFPTTVDSFGDEAVTGDETCARITYARNTTTWMIDKVAQTEALTGSCAAATDPAASSTVLYRSRIFYDTYVDDTSFGLPPTRGNVVRTEELDKFNSGTPVYVRTFNGTYDSYGRMVDAYNALGHKTVTAYTTDTATGLVTGATLANPLGHTDTVTVESARQQPVKTADANNVATEITYDGLGRVTQVWLPGRARATETPSIKYTYLARATGGPTAVTTESLLSDGESYLKSVALMDGFLRLRQTQAQAPGGGRTVSETLQHVLGGVDWTSAAYYDSTGAEVDTTLGYPSGAVPSSSHNLYDNVGRSTAAVFKDHGNEKWRTTLAYGGDRVHTTPPLGGNATTAVMDVFGRTVELRQYKNRADVGSTDPTKFDKTSHVYTPLDQLKTVIDPTGNQWAYGYDLRGRSTTASDPDHGTTEVTYDAAGQPVTVKAPLGTGTATTAYTYDALGRPTSMRDDSITGNKRIEWVYDTLTNGKGKLTSATRYHNNQPYVSKIDAYDTVGRITSASITLPSATEADLCAAPAPNTCTYTMSFGYRANGQLDSATLPAAADLAAETLWFGYNDVGQESSLQSSLQKYAGSVIYDKLGQLIQRQLGNTGKRVALTNTIDEPTSRLTNMSVLPEGKPQAASYTYTYDQIGNLTKLSDAPAGQTADHQCYQYDHLRRLTEAWTPATGDCNATKTVTGLGGPAPYWHSWTFDPIGNRKTETQHAATNTTLTYTYPTPGPGVARPHAVTSITASGGQSWTRNYTYDNAGNTKTRPNASGGTQNLTFDGEGKLTSLADGTGTTSMIYGPAGSRLIRKDPDGSKTLYLPGGTEVRNVGTVKTAKRYYQHAGTTIATRTAAGVTWLITDHHGTAELAINRDTLAVTKRRTLPYGAPRGSISGTWPTGMDKGFVGGTNDPTGLTHIGAREYDPTIGRFISDDPITDHGDPQQANGYSYANNNPVTFSDPSGLAVFCGVEGDSGSGGGYGVDPCFRGYGSTDPYESPQCEYYNSRGGCGSNPVVEAVFQIVVEVACPVCRMASTADSVITTGSCLADGGGIGCLGEPDVDTIQDQRPIPRPRGGLAGGGNGPNVHVPATRRGAGEPGNLPEERLAQGRSSTVTEVSPIPTGDKCKHSFDPDTQVLLADGTTKEIDEIRLGDIVVATDPERGHTEAKTVTALHRNLDNDLTELTVTNEQTGESTTLKTTWHHPFWDATTQSWVDAADLEIGHRLLTDPDTGATPLVVTGVHNHVGAKWMHDLTIADIHTYYVIAGNTPVLVHNCGSASGKPRFVTGADGVTTELNGTINARSVRFTQDSAGSTFKDGRSVADLANGLADGTIDPMSLPAIKIFRGENGEIFSLDNRRLFAGQYADVDLPYQWATPAEIGRRNMTYVDGGLSIRIRGIGWWSNYD